MSKKEELQIIPRSELHESLNSLLRIAEYKNKKRTAEQLTHNECIFLQLLCQYSPIGNIVKIFGQNTLKQYKELTLPALLCNLCVSRKKANGKYGSYDEKIAEKIKDIFGIKNIKVADDRATPNVSCQISGKKLNMRVEFNDDIKASQIILATYTNASDILHSYDINKISLPRDSNKVTDSFLKLIESIDQDDFIIEYSVITPKLLNP